MSAAPHGWSFPARFIAVAGLALLASGCALDGSSRFWNTRPALKSQAPKFDVSRSELLVVTGHFASGRHYAEDPDPCDLGATPAATQEGQAADPLKPVCIVLDTPPMRLELAVESRLYGTTIAARIFVVTGAHFGLERIQFGRANPQLIVLYRQDGEYMMPRYASRPIARTLDGAWAVPLINATDRLWLLPCETQDLARALRFSGGAARQRIEAPEDPKDFWIRALEDNPNLIRVGDHVESVRGVLLSDITNVLAHRQPRAGEEQCNR